jgi:hypothetical protein
MLPAGLNWYLKITERVGVWVIENLPVASEGNELIYRLRSRRRNARYPESVCLRDLGAVH